MFGLKIDRRLGGKSKEQKPKIIGECPKDGSPVTTERMEYCIKCVGGDPEKNENNKKSQ